MASVEEVAMDLKDMPVKEMAINRANLRSRVRAKA